MPGTVSFQIVYRKPAQKALVKMPRSLAERFLAAFERIAGGMDTTALDIKLLKGREGYRLRIGEWRAIYRVEAGRLMIEVVDIGPRGDVYK